MAPDPPDLAQQAREQEIEKLAQEIGRLIQRGDPRRREDLKELAFTLIREELIHEPEGGGSVAGTAPAPFNPLGTGVLIFCLGAGLSFVFGPVGLMLMAGGVFFVVWGALISWLKR
ncbi:MAG TPA: hypothetical protein VNN77_09055 [candidate division Zixibacteria bacterium]|nr:hypothetical protein [candidate division Zixibacteria bacterium]